MLKALNNNAIDRIKMRTCSAIATGFYLPEVFSDIFLDRKTSDMLHKILFTGVLLCLAGCAASVKTVSSLPMQPQPSVVLLGVTAQEQGQVANLLPSIEPPADQKEADIVSGIIFGKTEFKGLLKTSYVRLLIVNREDPAKQYVFAVGDRISSGLLPWVQDSKVIEPGHFVLELPPGNYKMTQVAIPAGSTLAEEGMELDFSVQTKGAVYLGTLMIDGTKEKVKFGGIPLIRPGFEYVLEVRDEFDEAVKFIGQFIPEDYFIKKDLFTVVSLEMDGIPTAGSLKTQD